MINFAGTAFKTGNRHGIPHVPAPKELCRIENWPDMSGEAQINTGIGGREITLDAFVVDLAFNNQKAVYDYLKTLHSLINKVGKLEVDPPGTGNPKVILENCAFKPWELVPQEGQQAAVPMPDVVPYSNEALNDRIGPGAFYIEVIFHWYQLQV